MEKLKEIVAHFRTRGNIARIEPLGAGLINDTYKVTTAEEEAPDYVLQRINHVIFQDVELLQNNIVAVTRHLRTKLTEAGEVDIDRKVLTFIETATGKSYHYDGESYWRLSRFIPRSKSYDTVNPSFAHYAGEAFGRFQAMLADLPVALGETIPNFHNIEFRLHQLQEAIRSDKAGRVAEVQYYLEEIARRSFSMCRAERLYREGQLPKRICHCDTKVNNMLFDEEGQVLCVIDLDTVMPSFIFSDYGDFLRTAANTGQEDEREPERIGFDMDIFKAFTQGYLKSARSFLTPIETAHLPYAVALFPYMQCVRFLTDYLNGDTYYKTRYPDHNLIRTRAQFRLLQCVEERMKEMQAFINA